LGYGTFASGTGVVAHGILPPRFYSKNAPNEHLRLALT
jgi:hypothetical protein